MKLVSRPTSGEKTILNYWMNETSGYRGKASTPNSLSLKKKNGFLSSRTLAAYHREKETASGGEGCHHRKIAYGIEEGSSFHARGSRTVREGGETIKDRKR